MVNWQCRWSTPQFERRAHFRTFVTRASIPKQLAPATKSSKGLMRSIDRTRVSMKEHRSRLWDRIQNIWSGWWHNEIVIQGRNLLGLYYLSTISSYFLSDSPVCLNTLVFQELNPIRFWDNADGKLIQRTCILHQSHHKQSYSIV